MCGSSPRKITLLILSLFANLIAFAQIPPPGIVPPQPPQARQEKPKADCVIAGQVVNLATGEPLRKAKIVLTKQEARDVGYERDVNAEGRFEFRNLEPGRYALRSERTGFVGQSYGAKRPGSRTGATITLAQSQEIKDVVLKLTPHSVVLGRVVDEEGEPMAHIEIEAMKQEWSGRKRQLVQYGAATTNDLGEYRMFGVAPGTYFISATRRAMNFNPTAQEPLSDKPEENYITTWYPGSTDAATSSKVVVRPGSELRGIDLRMAKTRVFRVRGKILSPTTGKPVTGFVLLMPRGKGNRAWNEMRQAFMTDPTQGFELKEVPPGQYTLRVQAGLDETLGVFMQNIDVSDSHIENLVIRPSSGGQIAGKVEIDDGKADDRTMIMLEPWDDTDDIGMNQAFAQLKEDGTFTLKNVQPGRFRVVCQRPDTYMKAASAGDQDLLENPLDTTEGLPASILVRLSGKGPEASGTVQNEDNKPVTGATVALVPEEKYRSQWANYGRTTTDQYGAFKIKDLRPGKYKAFAWEDLDGPEYMDPDFLKPLEGKGIDVTLKEGAKETLTLDVIPAAKTAQEKDKK